MTLNSKEKSNIQELLSILYLRLNGYFTTGFIVHSKEKKVDGEIDVIAVRFSLHNQDDTTHNSSEFLENSNNIDLIIAEVKSKGQPLKFNDSLRTKGNDSIESIKKILLWSGLLNVKIVDEISRKIYQLIQTEENSQLKTFRSTGKIKTKFGVLKIRPVLFSPEKCSINNADKFVNWTEINSFIWKCLCPSEAEIRIKCGTRYNFEAWGIGLEELVKVYKDRQKSQERFENIKELYRDIENNRVKRYKKGQKNLS